MTHVHGYDDNAHQLARLAELAAPALIPGLSCWCDHPSDVHSAELGCWLCDCTAGRIVPRLADPHGQG